MHLTDALETKQQTAKLVFPGKEALNSPEALFEDGRIEALPATALRGIAPTRILREVRRHAAIEDCLAVGAAIVDAVQADG